MTLKRVEAGFAPILELLKASFAVMDGRIDPPSSLHRLDVAGVARQATEGEIWAIYSTGAPIACVFLTKRPDTLTLGKLAVAPDRQREGLGRRLVDCALTRAMGAPAA
ncbi:MAG: GNAT family N-acetyltransferase [Pseudomonadota bacterium]